jgi:hypothetical protein
MEDAIPVEYILPCYLYISLTGHTSSKIDGTVDCLSFASQQNEMLCAKRIIVLYFGNIVLSDETTYHNRETVTSG